MKNVPGFWLVSAVLLCQCLKAQIPYYTIAEPFLGKSAYTRSAPGAFSTITNQAALANVTNSGLTIYGEKPFLLDGLTNFIAVATLVIPKGQFALLADHGGSSLHHESKVGVAYAKKLGTVVDAGVQFNYHSLSAGGYGKSSALGVDLACLLHINPKLHAGIQVKNPASTRWTGDDVRLPQVFKAGVGFEASEKFLYTFEMEKREDTPSTAIATIQYAPVQKVTICTGINSNASSWWLSVGLIIRAMRVCVNSCFHPQLGLTPGIALDFYFSNKKVH